MRRKLESEYAGAKNVLDGRTFDGSAPLTHPVSFSSNIHSREAACQLAATLIAHLDFLDIATTADFETVLLSKFYGYLTKLGIQTPERIVAFNIHDIVDAVAEAPHLVTTSAGLHAIIGAHRQRAAQASSVLRRSIGANVPPRRILWECNQQQYRIEEATDPRHLQQDSAELRHCVGTCHNTAALKQNRLTAADAEATQHLHYWLRIKSGAARIFTITKYRRPLVTIEYDVGSCAVIQMEGEGRMLPQPEVVCPALHALRQVVRIKAIAGLPSQTGYILTPRGQFAIPNHANVASALQGACAMQATATAGDIHAAVANGLITVDITSLPDAMLAHIIKADAPLQHMAPRDLTFPNFTDGNLFASHATGLHMPRFKHGDIRTENALAVTLPLMETGDLKAYECKSLSLPHHRSGAVSSQTATHLDLRRHVHGPIYAPNAEKIILPRTVDFLKMKVTCNRMHSEILVFENASC